MPKSRDLFWLVLLLLISCTSSPPVNNELFPENNEPTAIPLPASVKSKSDSKGASYFRAINKRILSLVQNGSPAALNEAMDLLHRDNHRYSEQEKVLIAISAVIMEYAWQNQKLSMEIPSDLPDTIYTSTINSLKRGIYENIFVQSDFFTLSLPSLLLLSNSSAENYYTQSEKALLQALTLDSNSVLVLYLLGTVYEKLEKYTLSLDYLNRAHTLDPDNYSITFALARMYNYVQDYENAYLLSTKLAEKNPTDMSVLKLRAYSAFYMKNYVIAETLVAQILQKESDSADFLLLRARILFELGQYLNTSTLLDVYARNDKTNKDYLLLLARLQYVWNKNPIAALNTLKDALKIYPDDPDVLLPATEFAVETGQTINGLSVAELVNSILKENPDNIRALRIVLKDALKKRDWQTAYNAGKTIISKQKNPEINDILYYSQACIQLGYLNEAEKLLQSIYTESTENEELIKSYIQLLFAQKKTIQAERLINSKLSISNRNLKSMLYYERSKLQTNENEQLSDLRLSLTSNPRNSDSLFALYNHYFLKKDYRKAQYYLKQVISLNPFDEGLLTANSNLETLLK